MQWNESFKIGHEPSHTQISEFVNTPLWEDLENYLQQTYNIKPRSFYSGCSMQNGLWKGWNVKYKKLGKSLCTLYPKQGYFLALVPIELREMNEAELLMPLCTEYTRNLYQQTISGHNGKSLAFEVKHESILHDMKKLITLRVPSC